MKRRIVVTDLTRFKRPGKVCVAGIDLSNSECIRPMPYLDTSRCQELNILPGAILEGKFTESTNRVGPHQEDYSHSDLNFLGPCTSQEFKNALECGSFNSVEEGFEISLQLNQKYIPWEHSISRSIVTIAVSPANTEIVEDDFTPGKIRLNFVDQSGRRYQYISITDLGFYNHAIKHHEMKDLLTLNRWMHTQNEILLRLGLSRRFQSQDGRDGYWLQTNGIYTFPDYHQDIRSYS